MVCTWDENFPWNKIRYHSNSGSLWIYGFSLKIEQKYHQINLFHYWNWLNSVILDCKILSETEENRFHKIQFVFHTENWGWLKMWEINWVIRCKNCFIQHRCFRDNFTPETTLKFRHVSLNFQVTVRMSESKRRSLNCGSKLKEYFEFDVGKINVSKDDILTKGKRFLFLHL